MQGYNSKKYACSVFVKSVISVSGNSCTHQFCFGSTTRSGLARLGEPYIQDAFRGLYKVMFQSETTDGQLSPFRLVEAGRKLGFQFGNFVFSILITVFYLS